MTGPRGSVLDVRPFHAPGSTGTWPCAICGNDFPTNRSWRVNMSLRGSIIACPRCAGEASRRRDDGD